MDIAGDHGLVRTIRQIQMINNEFWKAAASSWSWEAKQDIQVVFGGGNKISEELLKKPWDIYNDEEYVPWEMVDGDATLESVMKGGDIVLKKEVEEKSTKIKLDNDKFDEYFEQENMNGYLKCFEMLRDCGMSEDITERLDKANERLKVLEDAQNKFQKVYVADVSMFMESYIPEALNLSVGLIEYINAKTSEEILMSVQEEVVEALDTLLIGVNDKIDEIYKFAAIELKAAAKALNATMNMDGYVDSEFRIN